ncbi:MAG: toxin-antitoxin system TumE family protein, partial [Nostoc sp.]
LNLTTFPHHKHDGSEDNIVKSDAPFLAEILKEIEKILAGLTQLAQAMVREAHRAPKNYTEDIAISGRFSCSIK